MGVSKVNYGEDTILDLTQDTVSPEVLLEGYTAHNAAGNQIVGTASGGGGASYDTMTQTEADTGTSTEPRVITAAVLHNKVIGTPAYKIRVNPSSTPTEDGSIWITT